MLSSIFHVLEEKVRKNQECAGNKAVVRTFVKLNLISNVRPTFVEETEKKTHIGKFFN